MFIVDLHHIVHYMLLIHIINILWYILYNTTLCINHSLNVTNTIIVVSVHCRQSLQKKLRIFCCWWELLPNQFTHITFLIVAFVTRCLFVFCLFVYGPTFINYGSYTSIFCNLVFFTSHVTGLPSVNCPLNSLHMSLF